MKKTLSLVLALLMLLTMVPTMAMAEEPIVITWLMQGDNNGIYLHDGYAAKQEYPLNPESLNHAAEPI